jgi:hypothetical protein
VSVHVRKGDKMRERGFTDEIPKFNQSFATYMEKAKPLLEVPVVAFVGNLRVDERCGRLF